MSEAQQKAFLAATGGLSELSASTLFMGFALVCALTWGAWALLVCWKGWACGNVSTGQFGGMAIRVMLIITLLFWFVLS